MNKTQTSPSPDTRSVSPVGMQSSTPSPTPHPTFIPRNELSRTLSSEMEKKKNHPHSSPWQLPPIQTSFCRITNPIPSISLGAAHFTLRSFTGELQRENCEKCKERREWAVLNKSRALLLHRLRAFPLQLGASAASPRAPSLSSSRGSRSCSKAWPQGQ